MAVVSNQLIDELRRRVTSQNYELVLDQVVHTATEHCSENTTLIFVQTLQILNIYPTEH